MSVYCAVCQQGKRNHWRIYNLNLHMMFNSSVCVCLYASHKQLQTQMVFTYLYDFTQILFPVIFFTFCVLTHLNIVCTFHFPSQHFYRMALLVIRSSLFRPLHFQQLIHSHSFDENGISDLHNAFHMHTHYALEEKNIQTNCFNAWCVCLPACLPAC